MVLTGFGRMSLVERVAKRLPEPPPVVELDVASQADLDVLADRVREHVDGIDGVLHAIGFAPASCLGGGFLDAPWEDVATAIQVSAYSLKSLAVATLPLFGPPPRNSTRSATPVSRRWWLTSRSPLATRIDALDRSETAWARRWSSVPPVV